MWRDNGCAGRKIGPPGKEECAREKYQSVFRSQDCARKQTDEETKQQRQRNRDPVAGDDSARVDQRHSPKWPVHTINELPLAAPVSDQPTQADPQRRAEGIEGDVANRAQSLIPECLEKLVG